MSFVILPWARMRYAIALVEIRTTNDTAEWLARPSSSRRVYYDVGATSGTRGAEVKGQLACSRVARANEKLGKTN